MRVKSEFVGPLSTHEFLIRYMKPKNSIPPVPHLDFSSVAMETSVKGMCEQFIRAVEQTDLCPGLRLFITKAKQKEMQEMTSGDASDRKHPLCSTLAARVQSGQKRRMTKRRVFEEYYDFSKGILAVDVLQTAKEDPFIDNHERSLRLLTHSAMVADECPAPFSQQRLHPAHQENCAARAHITPEARTSEERSWSTIRTLSENVFTPQAHHPLSPSSPAQPDVSIERDTADATAAHERLRAIARAHFSRQHRLFLFQLVIIADEARFLLWDRSGAVVTEKFSYLESPQILAEFLARFSCMDDAQRGWDQTVAPATRRESALFTAAVRQFLNSMQALPSGDSKVRVLPHAQRTLDDTDTYPVWKVRVVNEATGRSTDLIVKRPFTEHSTLVGQGTRGYIAYDMLEQRLVFLKDTWRTKVPLLQPEFTTYQQLFSQDVPFLPRVLYGGDVLEATSRPQSTLIDELSVHAPEALLTTLRLEGFVHHRIVQDLAYPLLSVRDERELIQVLHDVLLVLEKAHESLNFVHRDLTWNNIMLTREGKCILNDWDHSGPMHPGVCGVGTPLSMSIRLLSTPTKPNEVVDDLESLYWILIRVAISRFATHFDGLPVEFFRTQGNHYDVSRQKIRHLGDPAFHEGRFRCAALADLMRDVGRAWGQYRSAVIGPLSDLGIEPPDPKILELAKTPSFWRAMFAEALRKCNAEQEMKASEVSGVPTHAPDGRSALSQRPEGVRPAPLPSSTGTKRKTPDGDAEHGVQLEPRRSKRLKARAQCL